MNCSLFQLPFLSIDFDRWDTDSESSGENEVKQSMLIAFSLTRSDPVLLNAS